MLLIINYGKKERKRSALGVRFTGVCFLLVVRQVRVDCVPKPKCSRLSLNPLSPYSDQNQFSPNDIHTLAREKVMRIKEMITKEKML